MVAMMIDWVILGSEIGNQEYQHLEISFVMHIKQRKLNKAK